MIRDKIFCFDIETIPAQSIPTECVPRFDKSTVSIGNRRDPIKLAEFYKAEEKKFEAGLVKKMSLDPYLCDVLCFCGMTVNMTGDEIEKEKTLFLRSEEGFDPDDYRELISEACDMIKAARNERTLIVTFNGAQFDFPVMQAAAMRFDVPLDVQAWRDFMRQYGHWSHCDLMQELCQWDKTGWKSLNFYSKFFGFGSKLEGMDGSQVYDAWMKGEDDKIKAYCRDDTYKIAQIYGRVGHWVTAPKPSDSFNKDDKPAQIPEKDIVR